MRRTVVGAVVALALGAATGCRSGSDAVCLRSDAGEVCANCLASRGRLAMMYDPTCHN